MQRLSPRYRALPGPPGGFRGALHCHTNLSDGTLSVRELAEAYRRRGFDFVCITDHGAARSHGPGSLDGVLLIDGVEINAGHRGADYHVVALGVRNLSVGLKVGLRRLREQLLPGAAFAFVAHPHWSDLETGHLHGEGFHAVEVYNHECEMTIGKGHGLVYWDRCLSRGEDLLGVAVDDFHGRSGTDAVGRGWVGVFAKRLERRSILSALKGGRFYASCGPRIYSINTRRGTLRAVTSPVRLARLIGRNGLCRRWRPDEQRVKTSPGPPRQMNLRLPLPSAAEITKRWKYLRLEVVDEQDRRAWTNALYRPVSTETI